MTIQLHWSQLIKSSSGHKVILDNGSQKCQTKISVMCPLIRKTRHRGAILEEWGRQPMVREAALQQENEEDMHAEVSYLFFVC